MSVREKVIIVSTSNKPITINYDGGKVVISPKGRNTFYKDCLPGVLPSGLIEIKK